MEFLNKLLNFWQSLSLKKKILYLLLFVLFVFLLNVGLSPLQKIHEFEDVVLSDSVFLQNFDSIYINTEFTGVLRENAYKQALVQLSEKDSIQLVINLVDSTACLWIKGVKIHETLVMQFSTNKLLERIPNIQYIELFSQPLSIYSQKATIVKEPVVIRQAPKDTIEAALNAWEPDTLIQKPAFLLLKVEHDIDIILEQDSNVVFKDKWTRFWFRSNIRINNSLTGIGRFFILKNQKYVPTIVLKMPVNDLRAIYRALPQNANIVIYY